MTAFSRRSLAFAGSLFLLAAASCAPPDPPAPKAPLGPVALADCGAAGGKVQRVGMLGALACVVPTPDAGKACRSSSDCTGACWSEDLALAPGQPATGRCQRDNQPFGCHAEVEDGRIATPALCVD